METDIHPNNGFSVDYLKAQSVAQLNNQAAIRATETRSPLVMPEGLKQITAEELQLIALFRCNDDRGQKLVFRIVTLHAVEFPKEN